MPHPSPATNPRRWGRTAGLAVRVVLMLERLSRRFTPSAPQSPPERLQYSNRPQGLRLEHGLYAAKRPPRAYVFIAKDEYFERSEAVLRQVTKRNPER